MKQQEQMNLERQRMHDAAQQRNKYMEQNKIKLGEYRINKGKKMAEKTQAKESEEASKEMERKKRTQEFAEKKVQMQRFSQDKRKAEIMLKMPVARHGRGSRSGESSSEEQDEDDHLEEAMPTVQPVNPKSTKPVDSTQ